MTVADRVLKMNGRRAAWLVLKRFFPWRHCVGCGIDQRAYLNDGVRREAAGTCLRPGLRCH